MHKLIWAMCLIFVANAANAVQVTLIRHNLNTSDGPSTTMITDSGFAGFGPPATDATWDWDGTTLTATGTYAPAIYVGSTPYGPPLLRDQSVNLSIDTSTSTATGDSYQCDNGTFLGFVHFCGGYTYGANYLNESTLTYGPGLAFNLVLGGDDAFSDTNQTDPNAGIRNLQTAYAFGLRSFDGSTLSIGTDVAPGLAGYEEMLFQVVPVPAAAWLFGSALGLLGWARRRASV